MGRLGTKERLLNAAELLFSREGYRGASLRAITHKAGVNLAAANYHFGSKERLLEEVIIRRMLPLNRERKERLEAVREAASLQGKHPDIKAVLTAFIEPTILFRESGPGARNFVTFIGRSFTDPDDTVRKAFHRVINPMFRFLYDMVQKALPHLSYEVVFWRLHLTIGALFHSMHICGSIEPGSMGIRKGITAESLVGQIIPFVTAGMKAP